MSVIDFSLIAVIGVAGFVGPMILRRLGRGQRAFGWMVIADCIVALVALLERGQPNPAQWADFLAVIAIGVGIALLIVPGGLRRLGHWAMASGRLRIAKVAADIRELLQPGMGARVESQLIETFLAVERGTENELIAKLEAAHQNAVEAITKVQVDERIVMIHLYARRWRDAVARYDAHIAPVLGERVSQLDVEIVRAYCELGMWQAAMDKVASFERVANRGGAFATLASRAHFIFLAFLGRVATVDAMVLQGGKSGNMPKSAQHYWAGVARLQAGEFEGAREKLEGALRHGDKRAKEIAKELLGRVGACEKTEFPEPAQDFADRLQAQVDETLAAEANAPEPVRLSGVRWRRVPGTVALIALNLGVGLWLHLATEELGIGPALVRYGANYKVATLAGDWWRLLTSVFVHIGLVHLVINMIGLLFLGRLVEQLFGTLRLLAIFLLAGVGGAAASVLLGSGTISAGASGGVFGLLGALAVELSVHRERYPQSWSRVLLLNLVFLAGLNIVVGFAYPIIDQAAHIGGLVGGAVAALALSKHLRPASTRLGTWASAAIVSVSVVALAWAGREIATGSIAKTVQTMQHKRHDFGDWSAVLPISFEIEDGVAIDPALAIQVSFSALADETLANWQREEILEELSERASGEDLSRVSAAPKERFVFAGWRSFEVAAVLKTEEEEPQYRVALLAQQQGTSVLVFVIYCPESLLEELMPSLKRIVDSVQRVGE